MIKIIFMMLVALLAAVVIAPFIFYFVVKNWQPSSSKINKDVNELSLAVQDDIDALLPWDEDELELLSYDVVKQSSKRGLGTTYSGTITSIYQEPMVVYVGKKYMNLSKKANGFIYAVTAHHDFFYRLRNNGVTLYIDEKEVGYLKGNGDLVSMDRKKLLASINSKSNELFAPVTIGKREIANIKKLKTSVKINERAFNHVKKDISKDEERLLLSLSIYEILKQDILPAVIEKTAQTV